MDQAIYTKILQIRLFEETVLSLFQQNKLSGTTHTCIGQEATAATVMQYVHEEDFVFSNHRCHGHYLAYGGSESLLLAEIMSKPSGMCQGRGGSQHIHYKNFFTNGIQGGIVPNAVGIGLANKIDDRKSNTVVFLGDGTLGQGIVYESLNLAAVYDVPVVFVVEDNQYAMSTRREDVFSGDIKERIQGFHIRTVEITSTDPVELMPFFSDVFSYADTTRKPVCAIVHNYRLGAHSKGDDTRDSREIEKYRQWDPVKIAESRLGKSTVDKTREEYRRKLRSAIENIEKEDVLTILKPEISSACINASFLNTSKGKYVETIREGFDRALLQHSNIIFLGEDIRDPYGGAFKATKGLTDKYGQRIINMPISEAGMVGIAVGMALNHKIPVVEIMFGDFVTLAFDQLLNHAAKYAWIYGQHIQIPLILRLPMGAKRGYGPTHSQSLEKFLIGIPLVKVIALSILHDPSRVYDTIFENIQEPTVVIENKKLYGEKNPSIHRQKYKGFKISEFHHYGFPSMYLSMDENSLPDVYAVTYGGMTEDMIAAAEKLMIQDEIQVDIIVLSQLSPIPILDTKEVISRHVPIVFVEEGTKQSGIGAEFISACAEQGLGKSYHRIAAWDLPVPNGILLENQIIPGVEAIVEQIREVIR